MKNDSRFFTIFAALCFLIVSSLSINAQEDNVILVGHLTYHTGPFAEFGPHFDGITDFTLEIINENPPLGQELVVIHEDIGTIGEARAARKLVLIDGVEILLNPAHGYSLYSDWMQGIVANNNRPIMPSVHGGAIAREIGGTANEPLFRGSPMDSAQSVAAMIQAQQAGAENIVIISTNIDGHQLQKDAAIQVAEELGLNVLEVIEVEAELPNYINDVASIQALNPDAIIIFSSAIDGGIMVKDLGDSGVSTMIIGTTEWQSPEFYAFATQNAIDSQEAVWVVVYTHTDTPAWTYYEESWNNSNYADLADAENSYNLQYYDLLNVTALAIEAAGTTDANLWAEYMSVVSEEPGTVVYTYAEGLEALRNGEDIDYSGISGEMNYNDTGVVSGLYGIFSWTQTGELQLVQTLDDVQILELDS